MKFLTKINQFFLVGISFSLLLTSCGGEEDQAVEDTISGRYVGGWNSNPPTSNIYENYPISAIVTLVSENEYEGEFFFTNSHVSCCGSENDGTIKMSISGTSITSWTYDDRVRGCFGEFMGSGTIESDGRLFIDFTGGDCEGEHADAFLFLRKE